MKKAWSIRTRYASTLVSALLLAGCGGGSDGGGGGGGVAAATAPAKLATTDEVAVLISAYVGLGSLDFDVSPSVGAASAKSMRWRNQNMAKATTTENCEIGTITFTDDTSTVFTEDGLLVANNCGVTTGSGSSAFTSSINGSLSERCTDTAQTEDDCNAATARFGEGANGNATVDISSRGGSGDDREDFVASLKADQSYSFNGNTDTNEITGSLAFNDRVEGISGTAVFTALRSIFTFNDTNGGASETVSGAFGVAVAGSRCSVGRVTLRTDSPLIYDSSFVISSGQLTLTGEGGVSARVNYNSNGSYTVTLANGQTRTYDEDDDFESLC